MPTYNRFWDLHVTSSNGEYDFIESISNDSQYQKNKHNLTPFISMKTIDNKLISNKINNNLPEKGYIASCISIEDILNLRTENNTIELIKWITNSNYIGKLRISSHGDGCGNLSMGKISIPAEKLIEWLNLCGMKLIGGRKGIKRTSGLITINLSSCMSARFATKNAKYRGLEKHSLAAQNSAIQRIIQRLRTMSFYGIEVTGSNEIVKGDNGQMTRVLAGVVPYSDNSNEFELDQYKGKLSILFPKGWKAESNIFNYGGRIYYPKNYIAEPHELNKNRNPSGGWILKTMNQSFSTEVNISEGWIIDVIKNCIKPPLGWAVKNLKSGAIAYSLTSNAHNEILSHSSFKVKEIS